MYVFPKVQQTLFTTFRTWLKDWASHLLVTLGLTGILTLLGFYLSVSGQTEGLQAFYSLYNGQLIEGAILGGILLITSGLLFFKRLKPRGHVPLHSVGNALLMTLLFGAVLYVPTLFSSVISQFPLFTSDTFILSSVVGLLALIILVIVLALFLEWIAAPYIALTSKEKLPGVLRKSNAFIQKDVADKLIHFASLVLYFGVSFLFVLFILAIPVLALASEESALLSSHIVIYNITDMSTFASFWLVSTVTYMFASLFNAGMITLVLEFDEDPEEIKVSPAAPVKREVIRKIKPTAKKPATKTTTKKSPAKKAPTSKTAAKPAAKSTATKRATATASAKKTATKKATTTSAKKTVAKKATTAASAKISTTKKAATSTAKATTKKTSSAAAKKSTAKKPVTKKPAAAKTPAKKSTKTTTSAKKTATKKTAAKK